MVGSFKDITNMLAYISVEIIRLLYIQMAPVIPASIIHHMEIKLSKQNLNIY